MLNHSENLLQNTDRIKTEKILSAQAVQFYSDLFDYQYKKACMWKELNLFPDINDAKKICTENGFPALADSTADELSKSIVELASIIEKHNHGIDLKNAVQELISDKAKIERVIDLVLKKESDELSTAAQAARMDFEEYIFLVINWLKPFFIALREKYAVIKKDEYGDRICPFCGYHPDMGALATESEGRRYLRCGLCENLWPYRRIACAVCGCGDAKQLEYFADEKIERYRMDVCNSCGGYIKTVRLNKAENIESCDLTIENILSAPLEGLLMQQGFKSL